MRRWAELQGAELISEMDECRHHRVIIETKA